MNKNSKKPNIFIGYKMPLRTRIRIRYNMLRINIKRFISYSPFRAMTIVGVVAVFLFMLTPFVKNDGSQSPTQLLDGSIVIGKRQKHLNQLSQFVHVVHTDSLKQHNLIQSIDYNRQRVAPLSIKKSSHISFLIHDNMLTVFM